MARHGPRRESPIPSATGTMRRDDPEGRAQPAASGPDSLEDEIRVRAYYRYLEREGGPGDEISDWLEAEADVLGRRATGVDADEKASTSRR